MTKILVFPQAVQRASRQRNIIPRREGPIPIITRSNHCELSVRYSRRRRIGNSVSIIRLLISRGNASKINSSTTAYTRRKSKRSNGGGTNPGRNWGPGICTLRPRWVSQLGGEATDFVLLVMNPKGANSILGSKVKLGADASAAAGPKGRTAAADTDNVMRAEVLSYSPSRGMFAGISLEGSTLRSDGSANMKLYGRELSAKEIVRGHMVLAEGSPNLMQRLSCLPTAPHPTPLHRGKLHSSPLSHKHHLLEKRFIADGVASTG